MTYSLIEIFDEMMKESVTPFLKNHGFKKQNLNLYRKEGDLKFLFNFQKSSYNSVDYVSFFINCGIYSDKIMSVIGEKVLPNPKEYECHFNSRINNLSGSENKQFDIFNSSDKLWMAKTAISELESSILFYKTIQNHDVFLDLLIEKGSYFYENVFQYLCKTQDLTRLQTYFHNFLQPFVGDERFDFFEEKLNTILGDNGLKKVKSIDSNGSCEMEISIINFS